MDDRLVDLLGPWNTEIARWLDGEVGGNRISSLTRQIQRLLNCRSTVVLVFPDYGLPAIVTETTPAGAAIIDSNPRYLEGGYLLDPFYNFALAEKSSGAFRIADVAPMGFEKSEYYQVFYKGAGIVDELCTLCALPGDLVLLACARIENETPFTDEETSLFLSLSPVVQACLQRWWYAQNQPVADNPFHRQIVSALQQFGTSALTPREIEVLHCMLKGHSIKSLADHFDISTDTVKHHRKNIYTKLAVRSQGELFDLFLSAISAHQPERWRDPLLALRDRQSIP